MISSAGIIHGVTKGTITPLFGTKVKNLLSVSNTDPFLK